MSTNANNSPRASMQERERPLHFFFLHVFIMIGQFLLRVVGVRVPLMLRPDSRGGKSQSARDHWRRWTEMHFISEGEACTALPHRQFLAASTRNGDYAL